MKVQRAVYTFDRGDKKFTHYLYSILDNDNILRIVNDDGQDPHLVDYYNTEGIWGALNKLINGQGEDVAILDFDKIEHKWISDYLITHQNFYNKKTGDHIQVIDTTYMLGTNHKLVECVTYVNAYTDSPKYTMIKKDFVKLYANKQIRSLGT